MPAWALAGPLESSRKTLGEDLELDVAKCRCSVLFVSRAGAVSQDALRDVPPGCCWLQFLKSKLLAAICQRRRLASFLFFLFGRYRACVQLGQQRLLEREVL